MIPILPAPFTRKGETVGSLRSMRIGLPPPWGGPAEAA